MTKKRVLTETNFKFPDQTHVYRGKVRDVYFFNDETMAMVVTDRISAFDVVLPKGIPYKGQILNQIASRFLEATEDIVLNWKISTPDPNVTYGHRCEPFKVEMVIRGYLTGHAWREYKAGKRMLCGVVLPEGMVENQKFPEPIITPTTKALVGHDEDISRAEIISKGLVSEKDYILLEKYTRELFQRGTEMAAEKGLILVDTKYEFGKKDGQIYLIDEVHTPDSSRYFYTEGYEERLAKGESQKQLSKEFVRQWLLENGFQGEAGQVAPKMTKDLIDSFSARYIELYEAVMGEPFSKGSTKNISQRVKNNLDYFLVN
ncbi:MAG: phosphoribosylaminoimidazole-succinocarboxamide synthase [Candidatus Nomurabacteria bacterium GW2011_GWF2_35_66]|uniref:Phosphoribosylaminoimidazole-succinocarboxamide synthase n=1 Tax=Candidatus Nomurabacteria bacterium GW2011_GWE1_35_16 TaxID=1618761 RepID=A0A0G0BRX1_9BACT|nr:MAG: phosphoribosylaminoimidazole-succinocarboxamide synthase [Candidatus Nomurabacteria bacterium GW2011_GWF1_34_20]KKP62997.1 MAG: phosphoribosylaminoimidazole-succinocarboxamide synthase [Candidatus Nomurabacteria bacterium GW2011_GWE2_34_25]KKP66401.1 MAG: phosphoribosylaminoimidazole-succinocarboxamide synthase [Candidatus Nomurabacteria bacterium GW2011_GWE1_35_16]KKP83159.1 MAG: phosphoribosylaminoimidazole-succinocarboxamide synthase [Candidatus Nomurabacteria bacterium GW2011_GWF2_35